MSFDEKLREMMDKGATKGNFNGIKLSASQAQELCSGIQNRGEAKGLQCLWLGSCGIGDEQVQAVIAALKENGSSLEMLDLSSNSIGDTGATTIADSFSRFPNLQELYLQCNSIGDTGAKALAEAVPFCPRMIILFIDSNKHSAASETLIDEAINGCKHIPGYNSQKHTA